MKKVVSVFLAAVFIISTLSISVFAYKVGGALILYFKNEPPGAEFIDLLVPIEQTDSYYTEFNNSVSSFTTFEDEPMNITKDSEIAQYKKDGFVSYCVHYTKADYHVSNVYEEDENGNPIPSSKPYFIVYDEDIYALYETLKIAFLDRDGKILAVSNSVSVKGIPLLLDFRDLRADGTALIAKKSIPPIIVGSCYLIIPPVLAVVFILIEKRIKKKKAENQ